MGDALRESICEVLQRCARLSDLSRLRVSVVLTCVEYVEDRSRGRDFHQCHQATVPEPVPVQAIGAVPESVVLT
jgi:hypothetical protein